MSRPIPMPLMTLDMDMDMPMLMTMDIMPINLVEPLILMVAMANEMCVVSKPESQRARTQSARWLAPDRTPLPFGQC